MIDTTKPAIGILFTETAKADRTKPFNTNKSSRVYSVFSQRAEKYGLNTFVANHKEYFKGNLKNCWYSHKGRWKKSKDKRVDIVYSRFAASMFPDNKVSKRALNFKYKMAGEVSLVNHPAIDEFCWDKKIVSEIFPECSPKTFIVNSKKGLKIVLPEIRSEKVVIKPRYGTLGKDVFITGKDNLPDKIEKNTLVQEFIDTSKGIKRVTEGKHDMRLIMINGKLDHAHVRIPKKGSFTSNVALGGKKLFISNSIVPRSAKKMAKKVDMLFRDVYPRIFSVDFLFDDKGKPYIVECNSQPMIDRYAFGKYAMIDFYDRVIQALKRGIETRVNTALD